MATPRKCKDCAPDSDRPAPHPGPRCATHHRIAKKAQRAAAHESRVQKVYGLAPGEYTVRYALQGGRCAICVRATGATRRLSVDHDHRTGVVRGLLCRPCNDMLGHARDDPAMFDRAAAYLREKRFSTCADTNSGCTIIQGQEQILRETT